MGETRMKTSLVTLLFLLAGTAASAQECISQSEMQEIAQDFKQFKNLANEQFCYDNSQTSNLLSSIMFMRKTAFSPDMKRSEDELFSGRFSSSWYKYFTERISDMNIPSNCPPGVGAYVYGFGSTMYVCPMLLTANFTSLDRASVFMHEARHMDGFRHITCRQGPRAGINGACDNRIADEGSYAVTVETYAQIAKYAVDLHPALKAYSLSSAATYANETFDTPARVDAKPVLVLMNTAGQFFSMSLNSRDEIIKLGQSPSLGRIVMRAQHMILFPEDKTLPAKYVFARNEGDIAQSAGDAILEYNAQTPAQKADMKDMIIGAQWNARVYTNKIKFICNTQSMATSDVALPAGSTAGRILHLDGYKRDAKNSFLMTEEGSVLEFGCANSKPFIKAASITLDQKFKRAYKVANRLFAINQAGEFFEITNGRSAKIDLPREVGSVFELAPQQTYGFIESH